MKKKNLLCIAMCWAAIALGPCVRADVTTENSAAGSAGPAGITPWRFKQGSQSRKMMSLLSMLAKPGADKSHINLLTRAMEAARTIAELRAAYDRGEKSEEVVKAEMKQLLNELTGMLEFLSLAKPLVQDSLDLSPLHDSGAYTAGETPLLLAVIEMKRQEQEERLAAAVEDLVQTLRLMDQVRAIREALIFNMPGKVKAVCGTDPARLFDPSVR